jgi:hypothetical protein
MKTASQNSVPWKHLAPAPHAMEHRWGRRRACRARVSVSAGAEVKGSGQLRNVSMSGAFLETRLQLPLSSQIAIAVLRDDGARLGDEFIATVVRQDRQGVGIEWLEGADGPVCHMLGCASHCAFAGIEPA